ncbi:hypothetical protein VKY30_31390, partial [Klebsiella oxytoca]|nr:hypothetical protein [Klebsiella oxytoca]
FIVGGPVGDFELLLCHGTVCVVGKMRDLILQLSKSSIYSTKPLVTAVCAFGLNYLTNKICPAMVVINKSGVSNVHALRCITSFLLLLGLC